MNAPKENSSLFLRFKAIVLNLAKSYWKIIWLSGYLLG